MFVSGNFAGFTGIWLEGSWDWGCEIFGVVFLYGPEHIGYRDFQICISVPLSCSVTREETRIYHVYK